MSDSVDDLARLSSGDDRPESVFGQGVLTKWNGDTFENTVRFRQSTWTNLSVSQNFDGLSLQAGDNVLLARVDGDRTSSWFIMGRIDVPPLSEPVRIVSGDVIVDGGDIDVRDGGNIIISGGEFRSQNFDGDTSADDPGTTGFALGNNKLAMAGVFVPAIDALSDEVLVEGFTIDTTDSSKASVTITVPDWAETASVVTSSLFAVVNDSGSDKQVTMYPSIDGDAGFTITLTYANGDSGVETVSHSRTWDVSSVSTFEVDARMFTTSGSWNNTSNAATVTCLVIFKSEQ